MNTAILTMGSKKIDQGRGFSFLYAKAKSGYHNEYGVYA